MTGLLALGLLLLFLILEKLHVRLKLRFIILIAVVIRISVSVLTRDIVNHDVIAHQRVGQRILNLQDIYNYQGTHFSPFLPSSQYIDAAAVALEKYKIPYMIPIKLFYSVFDIGILILIYKLTNQNSATTLLYAVNPITIQVTNIHGQSDIPAIFFLLLAAFFTKFRKELPSFISLSLGVLWKSWPLLFIAPLARRTKNKMTILATFVLPILAILFYIRLFQASWQHVIRPFFTYRGSAGAWGITSLLTFFFVIPDSLSTFIKVASNVLVGLLLLYSLKQKQRSVIHDTFAIMLLFFIVTPSFGMQWVSWLVPYLLLLKPSGWKTLFVLLTGWLAFSQLQWELCVYCDKELPILVTLIKLSGIACWLLVIAIAAQFFRWSHYDNTYHHSK